MVKALKRHLSSFIWDFKFKSRLNRMNAKQPTSNNLAWNHTKVKQLHNWAAQQN